MAAATLHLGSTGPDVAAFQAKLRALGYLVDADGTFGPKTKAAVQAFQAQQFLAADGVIGPKTREAISFAKPLVQTAAEKAELEGKADALIEAVRDQYKRGLASKGFGPEEFLSKVEDIIGSRGVLGAALDYLTGLDTVKQQLAGDLALLRPQIEAWAGPDRTAASTGKRTDGSAYTFARWAEHGAQFQETIEELTQERGDASAVKVVVDTEEKTKQKVEEKAGQIVDRAEAAAKFVADKVGDLLDAPEKVGKTVDEWLKRLKQVGIALGVVGGCYIAYRVAKAFGGDE